MRRLTSCPRWASSPLGRHPRCAGRYGPGMWERGAPGEDCPSRALPGVSGSHRVSKGCVGTRLLCCKCGVLLKYSWASIGVLDRLMMCVLCSMLMVGCFSLRVFSLWGKPRRGVRGFLRCLSLRLLLSSLWGELPVLAHVPMLLVLQLEARCASVRVCSG